MINGLFLPHFPDPVEADQTKKPTWNTVGEVGPKYKCSTTFEHVAVVNIPLRPCGIYLWLRPAMDTPIGLLHPSESAVEPTTCRDQIEVETRGQLGGGAADDGLEFVGTQPINTTNGDR